jgi:hypothetical protein
VAVLGTDRNRREPGVRRTLSLEAVLLTQVEGFAANLLMAFG